MKLKIIGFLLLFLAPTMTLAASTDGINWSTIVPVIGAVVPIIIAFATVGMWITSVLNNMTTRIENKFETLEKKFDNKFETLEKKFDNKFENLEGKFDSKLKEFDNKLEKFERKFDSKLKEFDNKFEKFEEKFDSKLKELMVATPASNSSPLSINDRGRELAQDINANKIFNKHWQHLKQFVEATGATSNYDVQERSNQAALSLVDVLSEEDERIIKEAAYKQGMVYETALSLFAVMTRDKIFEERKAQNKQ